MFFRGMALPRDRFDAPTLQRLFVWLELGVGKPHA